MGNLESDTIASHLVPLTEPNANQLNHLYSEVVKHLIGFFNRQGPRLASLHKLEVGVARGIFLAAYQQMLVAVAGMHFHMLPHQQQEMEAEIMDVIKKYAKRAELFLPTGLIQP